MKLQDLFFTYCLKRSFNVFAFGLFLVYTESTPLIGETIDPVNSSQSNAPNVTGEKNKVEYSIEESNEKGEEEIFFPRLEKIFQNKAVITNLERGADAINRSVDSLMDSVFYSLLDNEFRFDSNEFTWISTNLSRKVYSTSRGSYVVVDKFSFGPNLFKPITNDFNLPLFFGTSLGVEILDIYPRTDAKRLAESQEITWYRYLFNSWLGALPLLARILPPSFNSNELYNPIRQIETPVVFPSNKKKFYTMGIGSVRSYSINGGVRLPLDLTGRIGKHHRNLLDKSDLNLEIPFGIILSGDFRVNVLRKTENIAWVGLTKTLQFGHYLTPYLGGVYYLFSDSIKQIPWGGIPLPISPINTSFEELVKSSFDQLYEFNLSYSSAEHAYKEALKGNFIPASILSSQKDKGVKFHFNRKENSLRTSNNFQNNLLVYNLSREDSITESEIEIIDDFGKLEVLETHSLTELSSWDILVGGESISYSANLEMKVKNISKVESQKIYKFVSHSDNPYSMSINLEIKDRFSDASEYKEYIKRIRSFTKLSLTEFPLIPITNKNEATRNYLNFYFLSPDQKIIDVHSSKQAVGKFSAQGMIYFSTEELEKILQKPIHQYWQTFLDIFDTEYDHKQKYYSYQDPRVLSHLKKYVASPARLIISNNFWNVPLNEVSNIVESLVDLKQSISPIEIQKSFTKLFNTSYPEKLLEGLYRLSDIKKIPRKIQTFFSPANSLDPELQHRLKKLNGLIFSSNTKHTKKARHRITKDKLNAFFPQQVKDNRKKPKLSHTSISAREADKNNKEKQIFIEINASDIPANSSIKTYVRMEQSGKLLLGRVVLGQQVIELHPTQPPAEWKFNLDKSYFSFYLTGPQSPLSDFIFDSALALGGEFILSISISSDNKIWSDEKTFRFSYEDGNITPPKTDS